MPAVLEVGDGGDTHYLFDDPECINWWRTATLANQPYLKPTRTTGLNGMATSVAETRDVVDELMRVIGAVEAAGCEVMVLDQTRVDIGLPVVKVFAVGLRHFWARFAHGRLYDVPVAMGDLKSSLV